MLPSLIDGFLLIDDSFWVVSGSYRGKNCYFG